MSPAVAVTDLFRVYSTPDGDAAALQGLTLVVREGEVVTVLGPSGSGKTTLLRVLAGLDGPSAGTVRVFGLDIGKLGGRRLATYRAEALGYLDQHYSRALAPELTARELVALQPALTGTPRRARFARADELLERVGLFSRRDAYPAELSGGEQQRVAVCAAVAHRPRLLLADEPTGELDAASARVVYELIGELVREEGCTTVMVSHDPESAAVADRIVRVRDGRVSEEAERVHARDESIGEEAIVVGKGGWLRLPEELLRRAGIGDRAAARLESRRIVVVPPPARRDGGGTIQELTGPGPEPSNRLLLGGREGDGRADRETSGVVAEARSLTKRFGEGERGTTALDGLTASFPGAGLFAVTGPSGSGKTTFLHLLAGLEVPTSGEMLVQGTVLSRLDRTERAAFRRERIALVGQEPGLVPFLSAHENVELALVLRGVAAAEADERAREALAAVGLADRSDQRAARLSSGERERVAIARAVAARPALLLADEPTARLDEANALAIAALFATLAREFGTAVVCATHDPLVIEQADGELPLSERDRMA